MAGGGVVHHSIRTCIKGCLIRKVENHWLKSDAHITFTFHRHLKMLTYLGVSWDVGTLQHQKGQFQRVQEGQFQSVQDSASTRLTFLGTNQNFSGMKSEEAQFSTFYSFCHFQIFI